MNVIHRRLAQQLAIKLSAISLMILTLTTTAGASEFACGPMTPAEEQLLKLQSDNAGLAMTSATRDLIKVSIVDLLLQKKITRLKQIAIDVEQQRASTKDFERFVTWMSANLASYNRYIQAGSYAAVIGKMLPIPYAGQASVFAKFIAQFTASLNTASVAITTYLSSSQKFITMVNAIDPTKPAIEKTLDEATRFADTTLLKDMKDAQTKLAIVSDLSSGALSFLQSLDHYVGETDAYWNKVKGVMGKKVDPKEKSFLSESTTNLKTQAELFNGKLHKFGELEKQAITNVKALAVYDELALDVRKKLTP